MTDELDRIRSLRDDAPPPRDGWVRDTRAELLAMAEDEEAARAPDPGLLARVREWFTTVAPTGPRPVAVAVTAVLVVAVAVVGLTLSRPDTPPPPVAEPTPDDTPSPADDEVVLASSCRGGDGAYTVEYPQGWHANPGDVAAPCEYFDEEPVELEAQTGGAPDHPVNVRVVPAPFEQAATPGAAQEETSRRPATVAGRDGWVLEWTSTGQGALPEGLRSYRYVVGIEDERTLMLVAYGLGDTAFDQRRDIVDAMAESLRLHEPG